MSKCIGAWFNIRGKTKGPAAKTSFPLKAVCSVMTLQGDTPSGRGS